MYCVTTCYVTNRTAHNFLLQWYVVRACSKWIGISWICAQRSQYVLLTVVYKFEKCAVFGSDLMQETGKTEM